MMDVCRLCLSESPDKDIYQLKIGLNDKTSYSHILQFCLNIKVNEEMQITKKLCAKCYLNVLNFYKFKTVALKTDTYWRCKSSNVLVKHEALEEDEVYLSEVPVLEDPVHDIYVKYESGNEIDADLRDNDLEDDHNDVTDDKTFFNENLNNENLTDDKSGNSSDEDLFSKPQCTQDNKNEENILQYTSKNENLSPDEEYFVEEEKYDKNDPIYKPPKHYEPNYKPKPKADTDSKSLDYTCEVCNSKFPSQSMKRRHMFKVHRRRWKPTTHCLVCNKEVSNLKTHTLTVHEPHKLKYECEACGRRFLREFMKSNHACTSETIGFHCHICNKKLSTGSNLYAHIHRVHEREKGCLCQFCSKTFYDVQALRRHLRMHSNERPYKCTECDNSYKHSDALNKHRQAKHTDLKFPCTHCSKVFTNKGYLHSHMSNTHNNKNSFECGYSCGLTFTRRDNCRAHEKRKHGATLTRPGNPGVRPITSVKITR